MANWFSDPPLPGIPSPLTLTVEEVEMRDTAYRLRVNAYNLTAISADPNPVAAYADHLTREGYVFGLSRMASINQQIVTDQESLERFGAAARKVLFADSQREAALHQRGLKAPPFIRRDAKNRIDENCAFIEGTFADVGLRIAAYREAIDRTVLETPPAGTDVVGDTLDRFVDRAAMLRSELLQPCLGGVVYEGRPKNIRPFK